MHMFRLGLLVVFVSANAFALKCATCPSFPTLLLPDQSVNVPTNAVFRVEFASPAGLFTLKRTSDEQEVAVHFSTGPGSKLWTITPEAPLEAQTQYTMSVLDGDISFTTGDGEDLVAPEAPVLKSVKRQSTIGFCASEWWNLELEGGSDDATPRDELVLFVQTSESDELADASYVTTMKSPMIPGWCFKPPKGASFPVTIQVMDRAGNLSGSSNMKRAPACSVSLGGTMCLLAVGLLRRRNSRARSEG
jgi:hypothetical protein